MAKHTPPPDQQRLVAAWRASGQSMAAFARARDLHPATFATWVARHPVIGAPTGGTPAFLPVRVDHAAAALDVTVNDLRFVFAAAPPPAWFAAVLRGLAAC